MRCTATTTKGTRCKRPAEEGHEVCAMHLRVREDAIAAGLEQDRTWEAAAAIPQEGEPVENRTLGVGILATNRVEDQPPLVQVVFWGATQTFMSVEQETLEVANYLAEVGGCLDDLMQLVDYGIVADWAVGYWRGCGYRTECEHRPTVSTDSGEIPVVVSPARG